MCGNKDSEEIVSRRTSIAVKQAGHKVPILLRKVSGRSVACSGVEIRISARVASRRISSAVKKSIKKILELRISASEVNWSNRLDGKAEYEEGHRIQSATTERRCFIKYDRRQRQDGTGESVARECT